VRRYPITGNIEGARRAGLAVIDVTELDRLEELLERI